jgi:hypothetical protein
MLHLVTLNLARTHDFPDGSSRHGYEIVAPLDAKGRLNADEWRAKREKCRAKRFWQGEPDRHGSLVHRAGGMGGSTWLIDYNAETSDDDEPGFRLQSHSFIPDEYVSFREEDGTYHTFKVVSVRSVEPANGTAAA